MAIHFKTPEGSRVETIDFTGEHALAIKSILAGKGDLPSSIVLNGAALNLMLVTDKYDETKAYLVTPEEIEEC
jgi:hypothetical protein